MSASTDGAAPFFVDREVIVITRAGVWLADGVEITHEPTRKLFARSLRRDAEGYFLSIGRETKRIEVQDTAFFVLRIDGDAETGFEVLLSNDERVRLDPATLQYRPGRLTMRWIPKGYSGLEEALFLHAPYFDLLKDLQEDGAAYFLRIEGKRWELAPRTMTKGSS